MNPRAFTMAWNAWRHLHMCTQRSTSTKQLLWSLLIRYTATSVLLALAALSGDELDDSLWSCLQSVGDASAASPCSSLPLKYPSARVECLAGSHCMRASIHTSQSSAVKCSKSLQDGNRKAPFLFSAITLTSSEKEKSLKGRQWIHVFTERRSSRMGHGAGCPW